jgi:hypothetical protein
MRQTRKRQSLNLRIKAEERGLIDRPAKTLGKNRTGRALVLHRFPQSTSAPTNDRNAFKHGVFTRQAIAERKQFQAAAAVTEAAARHRVMR